jgi:hypothetical protein
MPLAPAAETPAAGQETAPSDTGVGAGAETVPGDTEAGGPGWPASFTTINQPLAIATTAVTMTAAHEWLRWGEADR